MPKSREKNQKARCHHRVSYGSIVATNIAKQVALISRGGLTPYMWVDPVAGIRRFAAGSVAK